MIDTTMNGSQHHVAGSAGIPRPFSGWAIKPGKVSGEEKSICDVTRCLQTHANCNAARWSPVVRLGRPRIRNAGRMITERAAHLFPTFQPSTAGALLQDFALVLRVLAAFPWRLMFGLIIHMTPRHHKTLQFPQFGEIQEPHDLCA